MRFLYILCLLPYFAVLITAGSLIPSEKCSVWDSPCITRTIRWVSPELAEGLPSIGTQRMDPFQIPLLHLTQGGVSGDFEHMEMRGMEKAIIDKASLDKYSKHFRARFTIPTFTINSTYVASGFLHSIPFNGKGNMYIRVSNLEIDVIMVYDLREDSRGKKFCEFKHYYYTFDTFGSLMVLFDNLNGGNQTLSASVHNYIHKNGKAISAEYGRKFLEPFMEAGFNVFKTFAHFQEMDLHFFDF